MEKPFLSLCMIVKNEEDQIHRCLNSVKNVVDEIIIVDTGSTDKTIEICNQFQAKVKHFDWNGSFADARNYSLQHAIGDWILWMDADEELDNLDIPQLKDAANFEQYDVLSIHLVNYYGDKIDKDKTTDVAHIRLFRRSAGITFVNKIHEYLDVSKLSNERIGHLNVKIHHYGYLDSIIEKKNKYERNMKMLERQIENNEKIYWAHYYIAMEYYRKQQLEEAFEKVNLSIRAFLEEKVLPPSMVYKLKYSILIAMGSFKGAWPAIESAIALYPDYVDLRFFKGVILYNLHKYNAALKTFEECIEMGETNIHYLILRGVGSFQSWYFKGLCQQKLGNTEEAIVSFMRSLAISPQYQDALDSLNLIKEENKISVNEYIEKHFKKEEYQILKDLLMDKDTNGEN